MKKDLNANSIPIVTGFFFPSSLPPLPQRSLSLSPVSAGWFNGLSRSEARFCKIARRGCQVAVRSGGWAAGTDFIGQKRGLGGS